MKKNDAHHIYGSITGANYNCKTAFFTNIPYFLDWIRAKMSAKEKEICQTNHWSTRGLNRWHARLGKDGCNIGKVEGRDLICISMDNLIHE